MGNCMHVSRNNQESKKELRKSFISKTETIASTDYTEMSQYDIDTSKSTESCIFLDDSYKL